MGWKNGFEIWDEKIKSIGTKLWLNSLLNGNEWVHDWKAEWNYGVVFMIG